MLFPPPRAPASCERHRTQSGQCLPGQRRLLFEVLVNTGANNGVCGHSLILYIRAKCYIAAHFRPVFQGTVCWPPEHSRQRYIRKHMFADILPAHLESHPDSATICSKTLSHCDLCQNIAMEGFWNMLVGYMRVSSDSDRQTTDLQKDALLAAGVDERHLFEDKASGARSDRSGLAAASGLRAHRGLPGGVEAGPTRPVIAAASTRNRHRTRSQAGRVSFPDRADGYDHATRRVPVQRVRCSGAV